MLQRREAMIRMGFGALLPGLLAAQRSESPDEQGPGDQRRPRMPPITRPIPFTLKLDSGGTDQ